MGYNKFIKSGDQLELYEYEKECFNRGRPRGYKVDFDRENLARGGDSSLFQTKLAKRRDNAKRSGLAFKRLVLSNITPGETPLLITFTFKENRKSVVESARFFKLFIQRLRGAYGSGFRYVAVPEFQKRGAVHYHALFWGLPEGLVIRERKTREIASIWREGFVDIIKTDNSPKLSTYLAKYMVKAICDERLFYHKAYFASRNIFRPIISAGFPKWWVEEEFELSTARLDIVKEYSTLWLGRGIYKKYSL